MGGGGRFNREGACFLLGLSSRDVDAGERSLRFPALGVSLCAFGDRDAGLAEPVGYSGALEWCDEAPGTTSLVSVDLLEVFLWFTI